MELGLVLLIAKQTNLSQEKDTYQSSGIQMLFVLTIALCQVKVFGFFLLGFMHTFKVLNGGFIIATKVGSFLNLTAIKEYGFFGRELIHGCGLARMFIL